jgi:hypothetical protein
MNDDEQMSMDGCLWIDVGGWKGLDGRNWTFGIRHVNVRWRSNVMSNKC